MHHKQELREFAQTHPFVLSSRRLIFVWNTALLTHDINSFGRDVPHPIEAVCNSLDEWIIVRKILSRPFNYEGRDVASEGIDVVGST
jgi:hypothetical protein